MEPVVFQLLKLPEEDRHDRLQWMKFNPRLYELVIKQMKELEDMSEKYICFVCGATIPGPRVEYLQESGLPSFEFTCITHSQTKKIKGIFSGEHGTSDLILCDSVLNDSVRSKFHEAEEEETEEHATSEIDEAS